jgi:hypothetical protein
MKIYVASSWRNLLQPGIIHLLRLGGHQVYEVAQHVEVLAEYPYAIERPGVVKLLRDVVAAIRALAKVPR